MEVTDLSSTFLDLWQMSAVTVHWVTWKFISFVFGDSCIPEYNAVFISNLSTFVYLENRNNKVFRNVINK
jgi:hypothetical protein